MAAMLAGCVTQTEAQKHAAAFTAESAVATRQISQRRYATKDDGAILGAGAAVLQDLGFLIDEMSAGSGLLVASKNRDAVEAGQIAGQALLVLLAAASRTRYDPIYETEQRIRVSLTTRATPDGGALLVRASFQRVIWNNKGRMSRVETIDDPAIYQVFFEKLNNATFLQAQDL